MHLLNSDSAEWAIAEDIFNKYPFAVLMLGKGDENLPQISHLPFHFAKEDNAFYCHVAANNPMVAMLEAGLNNARIVFTAEHAYVSPSWSADIKVPTWDYCVVHVDGKAQIVAEQEHKHQSMTVQVTGLDQNWQLNELDEQLRQSMFKAIRVLRVDISTMTYKYKMSQTKSADAKRAIIDQLAQSNPAMAARYQDNWGQSQVSRKMR